MTTIDSDEVKATKKVRYNSYANDFKIAIHIYLMNINNIECYFSSLVQHSKLDRASVSKHLDRLFDYGIVEGEWLKSKIDGNWYRGFKIDSDAELLIKSSYERIKDKENIGDYFAKEN